MFYFAIVNNENNKVVGCGAYPDEAAAQTFKVAAGCTMIERPEDVNIYENFYYENGHFVKKETNND